MHPGPRWPPPASCSSSRVLPSQALCTWSPGELSAGGVLESWRRLLTTLIRNPLRSPREPRGSWEGVRTTAWQCAPSEHWLGKLLPLGILLPTLVHYMPGPGRGLWHLLPVCPRCPKQVGVTMADGGWAKCQSLPNQADTAAGKYATRPSSTLGFPSSHPATLTSPTPL